MTISAGIKSLAVAIPPTARTNDYFRKNYPDLVARAEEGMLQRVFSRAGAPPSDLFAAEMAPYLNDPFRGTVERRVIGEDETSLSLELVAARRALAALNMEASDIDVIQVSSILPAQYGVGNAVFIAQELGVRCASWNFETGCTSAVAALANASALVQSGQFENVLVVISCTYSRSGDENDTFSWFYGDGAAAYVVGKVPAGEGFLGSKSVATLETCSTFAFVEIDSRPADRRIVLRAAPGTGKIIRETAPKYLRECCQGAAERAGVRLSDIDFLVTGTPCAWMHTFAAKTLEINPARTINLYPQIANIGVALVPVNLHAAAARKLIKPGDLVMLYNFGGISTAAAAVVRWGKTALGPQFESPQAYQ